MTCQLYRHFDKDGNLLYVGISFSAILRQSQHRQTARWWDDVATIKVETHTSREAALKAEAEAIAIEQPRHNTHRPGLRLPLPTAVHPIPKALRDRADALSMTIALRPDMTVSIAPRRVGARGIDWESAGALVLDLHMWAVDPANCNRDRTGAWPSDNYSDCPALRSIYNAG